jgi:prepilin-type N-terminal cleavage/methylation domain-containing protein
MRRISGFSLMEMMIVLLIVAVVAAATAPMVTKKMANTSENRSYWTAFNNRGIGYDLLGNGKTVAIGADSIPNDVNSNLYLNRNDSIPHNIIFDANGGDKTYMTTSPSIWLSTNPYEYADNSVVIGRNASLNSSNAVVIGPGAEGANNTKIIVIGKNAKVAVNGCAGSIAIGSSANSSSELSIAMGYNSHVKKVGRCGTAVGGQSNVTGANGTAIGFYASASNNASAFGHSSNASGASSVALGFNANPSAQKAIAIGNGAIAEGNNSIVIGANANAVQGLDFPWSSIVIGVDAITKNSRSIAIGSSANASGKDAIAIGPSANASAENSVAIGAVVQADRGGQIKIGTQGHSVVIPGTVILGSPNKPVWVWDEKTLQYAKLPYAEERVSSIDAIYSSDRRLKNVGKLYSSGLEQIKKLTIYNYTFKDDKGKTPRVGVMAQDLQKIFPDAVTKGEDGFLRIRMEDMFYAVINAVKENDKRISKLEKENKELLKRIESLEKKK